MAYHTTSSCILFLLIAITTTQQQQSKQSAPQPSVSSTPTSDFTCPEDFGYFPHPTDCTQYYVCVFGGALLESCTGGLMYSHDLQTCDWPRNVYCYNGTGFVDNNLESSQGQQAQDRTRTRGSSSSAPSSSSRANPSSYAYNPIKIETYGQLSRAAEESIGGKKLQNQRVTLPDDEYQQQRSGRSYEGSLPNYKEEIYQTNQGSPNNMTTNDAMVLCTPTDADKNQRKRRSAAEQIIRKKKRPELQTNHTITRRHSIFSHAIRRRRKPRLMMMEYPSSTRMVDLTSQSMLNKYKLPRAGLKTKPMVSASLTHRVSSPGNYLYPPSYYQTPTYGFVNIDKFHHENSQSSRLRPNSNSITTTPPPRVVKITTSKPFYSQLHFQDTTHDGSYYSSQRYNSPMVLGEYHEGYHRNNNNNPHVGYQPYRHGGQVHPLVKQKLNAQPYHRYPNLSEPGGGFTPNSRWKLVNNMGHHDGGYYSLEVNSDHRGVSGTSAPSHAHHHHDVYGRDKTHPSDYSSFRLKDDSRKTELPKTSLPFVKQAVGDAKRGSVSSSPLANTRTKYAGSSKYYDNSAAVQPPQQEDYAGDDVYANQRYAANVGNNTSNYYYAPAAPGAAEEDDSSYYVYDDEDDSSANSQQSAGGAAPAVGGQKYTNDFDYKYTNQQQQPVTTYSRTPTASPAPQQIITRRPVQQVNPTTTKATTRTRTRTNSASTSGGGSTSSSSTRARPTLKPKSSIVKGNAAPVRDVYLDPASRPDNVYESPTPNTPAAKCKKDLCVLPDCNCGGKDIPGALRAQDTPQIVLLTFDDSVNDLNKNLYRDLFEKGRKNPNGCPISATFYISHEWTDYSQVQNLAADGHEIASHSVSHSFGEQYSQKKWDKEINGQREILAAYGGVKLSEVRGMRAPFLAIGGNNMFKMLHDANFTYDSSMPIYENRPPSWPYTLDYRIFHDCMIPPCPTKSYPGVWEVPMVMWQDLKGGRCSMGDACSNPPTAEGVYQMLAKNFERHYTTNRAPFGLYYHAAWFTQPHHKEGFEAFLDTLVQMDDVWLVTNWQAIQWIRNPTPSSRILNYEPWSCHDLKDRPPRCNHPKVCNLWHKSGVRYMKTCQQCPQQYPWTGNTGVPYSNSV